MRKMTFQACDGIRLDSSQFCNHFASAGIIQILVFGTAYLIQDKDTDPTPFSMKVYVALFSLSVGILTLACYVAVQLIPISDFVVICFASPIFTLFLSACILR